MATSVCPSWFSSPEYSGMSLSVNGGEKTYRGGGEAANGTRPRQAVDRHPGWHKGDAQEIIRHMFANCFAVRTGA